MKIEQFVCNAFQENTYVVIDEATRKCAIIDPGMATEYEFAKVRDFIADNNLEVEHILLTHSHVDHLLGTGFCTEYYGVPVSGSISEQSHLPNAAMQAQLFGLGLRTTPSQITRNLSDGDTFLLGNVECRVIDCPGHSFAGLCYYFATQGVLMSGDVLFCGSVGRSDYGAEMGCNGPALAQAVLHKLFTLPHDTKVYPGHGPMTTIGYEYNYNPYI